MVFKEGLLDHDQVFQNEVTEQPLCGNRDLLGEEVIQVARVGSQVVEGPRPEPYSKSLSLTDGGQVRAWTWARSQVRACDWLGQRCASGAAPRLGQGWMYRGLVERPHGLVDK